MSTPLLSVIIPMYNCAPYIERCLNSLCNQGVDLEIIVIDDGSTDGGDIVVNRFILTHPEVRLIKQANAGISAARNHGLSEAKGKYIHFMDADDFIKSNTLCKIVDLLEENSADLARFQTKIIPENEADKIVSEIEDCNVLEVSNTLDGISYIESTTAMAGVTMWRHIFLSDFIRSTKVQFYEDLYAEEDYIYMLNILIYAKKVIICDGDKPHFWVKRLSSASNSVNSRSLNSYIKLIECYKELLATYTDEVSSKCRDYIYIRMTIAMQVYLFSLVRNKKKQQLKSALKTLKELGVYPFKTHRALGYNEKPIKINRIKWLILNTEPLLKLLLLIK